MPGVTGVAVVAVSDSVLGERVAAMVEAQRLDADAVREHVARALADYKVPSTVAIVRDLPRNALGKPDKPMIRRTLEQASG
jgi:non-ribosomal peptide synthetase component E (peptide arylation enzyme)